jgi:hypothetical protein
MHGKPELRSVIIGSVPFAVPNVIRFFIDRCCLKALIGPGTSLEWLKLLHINQGLQIN